MKGMDGKEGRELVAVCLPGPRLVVDWNLTGRPLDRDRESLEEELFRRYGESESGFFLYLGFCGNTLLLSESMEFLRDFAGLYVKKMSQTPGLESLREKVSPALEPAELDEFIARRSFIIGGDSLTPDFLKGLWAEINRAFTDRLKVHKGTVEEFVKTFSPEIHIAGRVYFHLVESGKAGSPFAFMATYSARLDSEGKTSHIPLKHALSEYGSDSRKLLELLSTVYSAAKESRIVAELIESGELFHPIALSAKEAYDILTEIPLYEKYGIICRIPNWWKNRAGSISVGIRIGEKTPARLGADSLLDFDVSLSMGGRRLSEEEARRLVGQSEGLALIKGRWVEVSPEKLEKTLEAYRQAQELMQAGGLTLKEAMQIRLRMKQGWRAEEGAVEITNGRWLESIVEKLRKPAMLKDVAPPEGFKGCLRPYQAKGLNWLCFLHSLNLGACLADDMGLGKTVQLLAFFSSLKADGKTPASLLVIPASLVSNWTDEIRRFSPELKYYVAHPSFEKNAGGVKNAPGKRFLGGHDLVITTYSMARRYEWLKSYRWNYVVLDEAQVIKNHATKQARAIKVLQANNRIIMTGTPVENRLSDLWSLFDFLNPGLLGSAREFSDFAAGLKENPQGYASLRKVTSPYILRRLKTDKSVISDLPEKIEMKTYSELGKKQAALYANLVSEIKSALESGEEEGIRRKGLILASLTKFKQICNHPDQYLGGGGFPESESGKFARLREICETIYEKREKALIFTQFREIAGPLKEYLQTVFGHEGLVFHGGTPVKKRREIVESFQNGPGYVPFMVLSIKAGGFGLNLTGANHVIHFDRWWNPAVENQATDRAFRIGQKKNVLVHKFITKGTLEEKIDAMLEEKKSLSDEVIRGSGEEWITGMSNEKLMSLFALSL